MPTAGVEGFLYFPVIYGRHFYVFQLVRCGCKVKKIYRICTMKTHEIIKIGHKIIEELQKSCISMTDCSFIGMYEEYEKLLSDGSKKTLVVSYLAKKYFISERRVWYLIKKFEKECTIGAS